MTHVRKQIRDDVAAAVTGLPTTGSRVFKSRILPSGRANLPCLLVFTATEPITAANMGKPPMLRRDLAVTIQAVAEGTPGADDPLDDILGEIEAALPGAEVSAPVRILMPQSIQTEQTDEGEAPLVAATLTYSAVYMTEQGRPDTAV